MPFSTADASLESASSSSGGAQQACAPSPHSESGRRVRGLALSGSSVTREACRAARQPPMCVPLVTDRSNHPAPCRSTAPPPSAWHVMSGSGWDWAPRESRTGMELQHLGVPSSGRTGRERCRYCPKPPEALPKIVGSGAFHQVFKAVAPPAPLGGCQGRACPQRGKGTGA